MDRRVCRKILSFAMAVMFPAGLFGADAGPTAMLYARGATTLNGNSVRSTSALFSGDLVQTSVDSVANIDATGSTVLILNDSLVQYEGNVVKLEHGGVAISTSKSMATHAAGVSISPSAGVLTEFDVRDVDGRVQIAARKGDLTISDHTGTTTLAQGQETTRDDSQPQTENRKKRRGAGNTTSPAASAGIMNSPVTIGIGAGIVGGAAIWVLVKGDEPVSPAKP
jgi:hypothetical protein